MQNLDPNDPRMFDELNPKALDQQYLRIGSDCFYQLLLNKFGVRCNEKALHITIMMSLIVLCTLNCPNGGSQRRFLTNED